MKGIYMAMASLLLAMLQGCDRYPDAYIIREEHEGGDGRTLCIYLEDSLYVNWRPDSPRQYHMRYKNICCRDEKDLDNTLDSLREKEHIDNKYALFYFHRASGRVDTLFAYSGRGYLYILSYVSGYRDYGKWILLENKYIKDIVGLEDLCDSTEYYDDRILQGSCTYEGQEKVFNSSIADYWIVNRYTTDFYGPFNMDEMKAQMHELGIPLPMKLDGMYDRYVYARDANGEFSDIFPKHFFWPRHRSRKGTVIE